MGSLDQKAGTIRPTPPPARAKPTTRCHRHARGSFWSSGRNATPDLVIRQPPTRFIPARVCSTSSGAIGG